MLKASWGDATLQQRSGRERSKGARRQRRAQGTKHSTCLETNGLACVSQTWTRGLQ